MSLVPTDGFFYDDLAVGDRLPVPAAVTLSDGLSALYVSITGDALPLSLDRHLCEAVTGSSRPLVNPMLLLHLSIGASTVATRNVLANLFYRNVVLHRPVFEGETVRTETSVVAMADARPKPGTKPRGKVLLNMTTTGTEGPVIEYQRCPLLPCRGEVLPGYGDVIDPGYGDVIDPGYGDVIDPGYGDVIDPGYRDVIDPGYRDVIDPGYRDVIDPGTADLDPFVAVVPEGWDLEPLGRSVDWPVGASRVDPMRDVVDNATSLVRLSHNLAAVHRDAEASPYPQRLVYGGHPVSLAQASLIRVHPGLATVLGWLECNHVGPVFEGDVLQFTHTLEHDQPAGGGRLRVINIDGSAQTGAEPARPVLAWRVVILSSEPQVEP